MKIFSLLLFIFLFLSLKISMADQSSSTKFQVNVGLVLDMDKYIAKMGLSCINMALSDFYSSNDYYRTRIVLHTRDSKDDVLGAAAAALDLLKYIEVQAILGPVTSMQAGFMIDLGTRAQVPIISYSATSSSLSSIRSPYFVRATQNDSSQVKPVSAIVQSFGWTEVVLICVDNAFGEGIVPFMADALQDINTRISYRSVIPALATDDQIIAELRKLLTMQTRVFIVHIPSVLASRFFIIANDIGMMSEGYAWILTDAVTIMLGSFDPSIIYSMQGVLGVKPYVPRSKQLDNFMVRWKTKFQQENPSIFNVELNVFGQCAYDAAIALAMAIEKAGVVNSGFKKNNSTNSTYLENFSISQMGPRLLQALSNNTFMGLNGDFRITDGQIQSSSAYQIVNVIGNGYKGIGFWTPKNGLVKQLVYTSSTTYTTSKENLGSILWPGDTTIPPKDRGMPKNGKKLRVVVPVKDGFGELVQVTRDPKTNTTTVGGYCIDVFDEAMKSLPYAVHYDYIPFATPDGRSAGTYDDMVYQVYLGNFDAVIGGLTATANRSQYVTFTLPYTTSGYSIIVPLTVKKRKKALVGFLDPLSWDLWLAIICSFVCVRFTTWVLKHRINENVKGPPSQQAGTIPWFSFSTMIFRQKEKILTYLTGFVLIIWGFFVLILSQIYTAIFGLMFADQQSQPPTTDINELINKGEYVGYQEGSFLVGFLKRKNIDVKKLVMYRSPEELDELFSNGSIAAAFDEIPYMKLFLSKHCSKYAMVVQPESADGFGFSFGFATGSPLVQDVSRRILIVTQAEKMIEIEKKWFGRTSCPDSSPTISPETVGLETLSPLFLITGIALILALIVYLIIFLHTHQHVLGKLPADASLWRKVKELARHFENKDISADSPGKSEFQDNSGAENKEYSTCTQQSYPGNDRHQSQSSFSHQVTQITNCSPRRSSFLDRTDGNVTSFEGTPGHDIEENSITGRQLILALIICTCVFVRERKHMLRQSTT